MAILKCKMCGGDFEISAKVNILECEYCGTKQTIPNVDDEKKINLFNRANRLRINSEFDKASIIYENIISEFPEEAEAYWGLCLCDYGIEYVDDPATAKKIPTCHRASFESLEKNENYKLALEYSDVMAQKVYRDEAREIDCIMNEILAVSKKEKPYDIFICYKETDEYKERTIDSVIAYDIYESLISKGYNVFFSRVTLEDKIGRQFEPYIFAALNSAKVMICIGTKYEYMHAVWVKNEWSRFLKLMQKDKSRFLIPCYKDMDPYDLPDEFKGLQAQDMGKLGSMQDLLRGIEKILPKESGQTVDLNQFDIKEQLSKAENYLQKQEWKNVQDCCSAITDVDPECAMAYVYQLARINRITKIEDFEKCVNILSDSNYYTKALRYADSELTKQLEYWCSCSEVNYKNAVEVCSPIREKAKLLDGILDGGRAHTVGLKTDGTVISCGSNEKGQRNVGAWRNIIRIACGDYHTVGLKSDGTVVACGDNENGQCEVSNWKNIVDISCNSYHTVGVCADGTVVACGSNENNRCDVSHWSDIVSCKSGYRHTVVQNKNGNLFAIGANGRKQCDVSNWENIVYYSANNLFTVGLRENGTVVACGDNDDGAINIKKWRNIVDIACGTHHTIGLCVDGTVVTCGSDGGFRCSGTKDWKNIVAVYCGQWHTMGICADGTIVHCGDDDDNKRDISEWRLFENISTIEEERSRAVVERNEKDVEAKELRKNTTLRQQNIKSVLSGGEEYSVAVLSDMTAISCGSNTGNKRLVRGLDFVLSISCGKDFTIALLYDGEKESFCCLGNNEYGQCDMPDISNKRVKAVSCGYVHTAILFADGTVYATGSNEQGQCDVSGWNNIIEVACGYDYTVGLKADGTVIACGNNAEGRINVNNWFDIIMIDARNAHTVGLCSDGSVVACGFNNHGQCNVSDWNDIIAISCGSHHTVGLRADGSVVACGYDKYIKVSSWSDIVGIRCTYWLTMGVKKDGTILAYGDNGFGQTKLNGHKIFYDIESFDEHRKYLNRNALDVNVSDRTVVKKIPCIQQERVINEIWAIGTREYENSWPIGTPKKTFNYDSDNVIVFYISVSQYELQNLAKVHLGTAIFDSNGNMVLNTEDILDWSSSFDRLSKKFIIREKDGTVKKTGKYQAVFWIDNYEIRKFEFIVTSNAECNKQIEQKKQVEANEHDIKIERIIKGVCQHCGGYFKGLFIRKCALCGRMKDY